VLSLVDAILAYLCREGVVSVMVDAILACLC
jgi:hypothetical protein